MKYLSWASYYEGPSDGPYYNVLLPRLMEEIILRDGDRIVTVPEEPAVVLGKKGRQIDEVAREICEHAQAFDLVFIHADTGGRALEQGIEARSNAYCEAAHRICEWPRDRCVLITPKHETEAWMLADPNAIKLAFGFRGALADLNLPANARAAERLADPKATLSNAQRIIRRGRSPAGMLQVLPNIAREQSFDLLRASNSFQIFEASLRTALRALGCLPR